MPFEGKNCRKLANGQDIDYSEKQWPQGLYSNMFIGIYSRSRVSVYRTIGSLVISFAPKQRLWVLVKTLQRGGSNVYPQSMF